MSQFYFHGLSTELLISIFNFLDIKDLCRLRLTCRRFKDIINAWDHILLKSSPTIITNQINEKFLSRCFNKLPTKLEKLRIQHNWKNGKYDERSLFYVRKKYMPWLKLDKENVWFSRGSKIFNHKRVKKSIITEKPNYVLSPQSLRNHADTNNTFSSVEVTKFVVKDDWLISGLSDGGIYIQSLNNANDLFIERGQNSYTSSVDISPDNQIVASGMRDNCFKIFSLKYNPFGLNLCHTQFLEERPWSVSFCEDKPLFAVGTSAVGLGKPSLKIYDTESFTESINFELGQFISATLDMKWDGPHIIWSCGNDCYLRRWDLRTGKCEQKFADPFSGGLYCFDYDYCNSIVVGTYMHGRAVLWDVRQRNSVQLYFMNSCKGPQRNSPVYSLSFDSEYLFAATDQNLNILNFNVFGSRQQKDYKSFTKTGLTVLMS